MAILKNIIFDLGAVLINIDFKKTEKAFADLGYSNFNTMYNQYEVNTVFEKLETGKISTTDFYNHIITINIENVTKEQIKNAWNALLLTWRKESIAFLKTLTPKYNLYLLSNTNAIHQTQFLKTLETELGITNFNSLFTKAYYSHEIQLRKPNNDVFEYVAKDANIKIAETLFIDDSYNNIDAAKSLGFQTHLLLPGELIEDLLILNEH